MSINIDDFIAKSNNVKLINHSKNVGILSKYIATKFLGISDENLLKLIEISGLLHDIGKIYKNFQDSLKDNKKTKNKFRHNEIGGAFLYKYLNENILDDTSHNSDNLDLVVRAVYWHHGITNKMASDYISDVLNTITDDDIEIFKIFVKKILGKDSIQENTSRYRSIKTPLFYENDGKSSFNSKLNAIRSCVISSDRIISSIEEKKDVNLIITENNISKYVDDIINKKIYKKSTPIIDESNLIGIDMNRFSKQKNIVESCGKTTIINAPAGFGKTMIGILWALKTNKKIIWVAPTNYIARSLFKSIVNDLKTLKINLSVELYIASVTECKVNDDSDEEFNSDIIITNIDNFLKPSISDKLSDRFFLINSANVVFDEFHEFVSSDPYFACFINIMKCRHKLTDSNTILLSATPYDLSHLWDYSDNKTTFLPEKNKHYSSVYSHKYTINITNHHNYTGQYNEGAFTNSILESQRMKSQTQSSVLIHSNFVESYIKENITKILNTFGKNKFNENFIPEINTGIISARMLRTSFDISFKNIYDSISSPQENIQAIGRCNRFGEFGNDSKVTLFKLDNNISESKAVSLNYDSNLSKHWEEYIKKYNGENLSNNDLYQIFNDFQLNYHEEIKKYINKRYYKSLEKLSKNIYPYRYDSNSKPNYMTANGNKLRSSGSEIFYIVSMFDPSNTDNYYNIKEFVGLFTTCIYNNFADDFNEDESRILNMLYNTMKKIVNGEIKVNVSSLNNNSNDYGFDYSIFVNKPKNKVKLNDIRTNANRSNTPYIRFDAVYHPDYGIIKINNINELNLLTNKI